MSPEELVDCINAGNFLDLKQFQELGAIKLASLINATSTIEETRELLNIENEFSQVEEDKIKEEHKWAYDD